MLVALTATTFSFAETTRIYCQMEGAWWWANDGQSTAAISLYAYAGETKNAEFPGQLMTELDAENHVWYIDIDLTGYQYIIFARSSSSNGNWGAQTYSLPINEIGNNDIYIIDKAEHWHNSENDCTGEWSRYVRTIYLNTTIWEDPNETEVFAVHVWNTGDDDAADYYFESVSGSNTLWQAEIRKDATYAIFLRKGAVGETIWANEWNRSTTSIPADKDEYTITGWHQTDDPTDTSESRGTWSKYSQITTAISNTVEETKTVKHIVNGQLFILRDGKTFNALGAELK